MITSSLLKNFSELDDLLQNALIDFLDKHKLNLEVGDTIDIQLLIMSPRGSEDYNIKKELE